MRTKPVLAIHADCTETLANELTQPARPPQAHLHPTRTAVANRHLSTMRGPRCAHEAALMVARMTTRLLQTSPSRSRRVPAVASPHQAHPLFPQPSAAPRRSHRRRSLHVLIPIAGVQVLGTTIMPSLFTPGKLEGLAVVLTKLLASMTISMMQSKCTSLVDPLYQHLPTLSCQKRLLPLLLPCHRFGIWS